MEFAYKSDQTHHQRTSTLYSTGLEDDNKEQLVLKGNSTDGGVFSLEDYYNSAYPSPSGSVGHFDSMIIKEPKFGATQFPEEQHLLTSAYNSAQVDTMAVLADIVTKGLDGAVTDAPWITYPQDIPVLCGLMHVQCYVGPDDTISQVEEDMELCISISVKKWKPLVYRAKRWMRGKTKSRNRSNRYYGRRYNRRWKRS